MRALTWSLVVATLNRQECLLRSLRANVRQDRPPRQVIVVDASADWQETRDRVVREVAIEAPDVKWTYLSSDLRSLPAQRNQGLAACEADVVFFLDDDSFMFRDCAAELLKVYEADPAGLIGGVCASLSLMPEGASAPPGGSIDGALPSGSFDDGFARLLKRRIETFWYQEELFIPYDGVFYPRSSMRVLDDTVVPVALFHGCRMTFRTAAVRKVGGFQEMLMRTAFGEDADLSYRVSREHALVMATRARIYHEQTPTGRAKKAINTALVLLNAIALYRLNTDPEDVKWSTVYRFLSKRAVVELLHDMLKPRGGLSNLRGVLEAFRRAPGVMALPAERLAQDYAGVQSGVYQGGSA